jgi:hypothetical protein
MSPVDTAMSQFDFLYNPNAGLGDCLSCFNTTKPIWSPSPYYPILRRYSSIPFLVHPAGRGLNIEHLHKVTTLGPEHLYNRVRIVSGMERLQHPRAILDRIPYEPDDRTVAFSFDVGANVVNQQKFHPRPRQLYPEHAKTIQAFISANAARFDFVEVGRNSFGFDRTTVKTGVGLEETIEILRRSRCYFGMHSGMMHLATAIGLPCSIVVNFPPPELLPGTRPKLAASGHWDEELQWLYPQHRYLHEDALQGDLQITRAALDAILPATPYPD